MTGEHPKSEAMTSKHSCAGGCCSPHGDCPQCGCAGKIERLARYVDVAAELAMEIERLTTERDRLRAALERYGSHWNDCPSILSIDATCTCGYREFCPQCKAAGLPVETAGEDARDAARYRWLRNALDNEEVTADLHEAFQQGSAALDAAIDKRLGVEPTSLPSHETLADHLRTLSVSTRCPVCGKDGPHEHTPIELIIYRNGVKYGRSLGS